MPKIVIDAREYSTTTGRYLRELIKYLQLIDLTNNYVILLKEKDYDLCKLDNENFSKVKADIKEFSFKEQLQFCWLIYKLKADLVHFPMAQQPILYFKKTITTIFDLTTVRYKNPTKNKYLFWTKQQIYKIVLKIDAKKSKLIICSSEYVKKDLINYTKIDSNKVRLTYLAAEKISQGSLAIDTIKNKKFIMYIGRALPHKNLDRLIDAFKIVHDKTPALYLVLAGSIDEHYLRYQVIIKDKDIPNIIFTDRISDEELVWLYQNCQAYVFPSLSEGFGLPGLEAMLYGATVLASNSTCLPEIYGSAAIYFDPLDTKDIARKIKSVVNKSSLRKSMAIKAIRQTQKYSWLKTAEQTKEIYLEVLNK